VEVANNLQEKLQKLIPILQTRTGPAIVYVTLQKQAEDVAQKLQNYGIECLVYHAGLPSEKRTEVQVQFMESERGVVCATIAFGMGIDKGRSLHSYLQVCVIDYGFVLANIRQVRPFIHSRHSMLRSQEGISFTHAQDAGKL
jgi:hypothetical protein